MWITLAFLLLQIMFTKRILLLPLWCHNDRYRGMDAIAGDVVLAGRPDDEGDSQGCPDELIDLLFNTSTYK